MYNLVLFYEFGNKERRQSNVIIVICPKKIIDPTMCNRSDHGARITIVVTRIVRARCQG